MTAYACAKLLRSPMIMVRAPAIEPSFADQNVREFRKCAEHPLERVSNDPFKDRGSGIVWRQSQRLS
jgi:hypothetical protein